LLADPKFVRIERVLGVVAYVEKNARGDLTYIVPELGDTPFKRIRFIKGYKRVEEPVKLTLGEPDGADVRGPDYPLVTERPVFDQDLEARIIEKPSPQFELAVAPSKSTTVTVEVVVDESGNVVNAWCVGDFCFSRVGRTAEEAAYNARVATKEVAGKSVISMGLIRYPIAAS